MFASTSPDELPKRRKMVQMSLRLFEKIPREIGPSPNVVVVKNYVLSDKPLTISAKLDKGNYTQGEEIQLTLKFHRKDKQPHGIRKVKVTLFQQVSFYPSGIYQIIFIKFVYSEETTKFCEISTLLLSTVHTDKSKVKF